VTVILENLLGFISLRLEDTEDPRTGYKLNLKAIDRMDTHQEDSTQSNPGTPRGGGCQVPIEKRTFGCKYRRTTPGCKIYGVYSVVKKDPTSNLRKALRKLSILSQRRDCSDSYRLHALFHRPLQCRKHNERSMKIDSQCQVFDPLSRTV
jgi:hypothetical protein